MSFTIIYNGSLTPSHPHKLIPQVHVDHFPWTEVIGRLGSWDPLDSIGACVWGDTKGGSRDVQGILWTAWGPVSEGTAREDPGTSTGSYGQNGALCERGRQGRILGCPRDPPDSMGPCVWGDTKGGSRDVHGILRTAWGLCLKGQQGRIPGCPRDPPDSMGPCVWGDTKGGSQDVQGILRTAWGLVSDGIPREDPGMSKGSSGQHGGLCLRGSQGRILGCPRDPLDSLGSLHLRGHQGRIPGCPRNPLTQHGQLCEMDMKRGSWDVLKILDPPKSERTRLDCLIWHEGRILGCPKNSGSSQDWKDKVRLSEESRTFVGNTGHECFHTLIRHEQTR